MPQPKPFQDAAIAAACQSFRSAAGSKRFLVADEVGLGKTVVAQQIIQHLAGRERKGPLVVYYITNGQRVAHQNLLGIIPTAIRPQREPGPAQPDAPASQFPEGNAFAIVEKICVASAATASTTFLTLLLISATSSFDTSDATNVTFFK